VQIYRGPFEGNNAFVVVNFPPLSLRQRGAYKSAVIDDGVSINATASIDCYALSFANILQQQASSRRCTIRVPRVIGRAHAKLSVYDSIPDDSPLII